MNNKIYKFLRLLILATSIVYFFYFIYKNISILDNIKNFDIQAIALIILLKVINVKLLSNINLHILKYLDIKLTNAESLDLTVKNILGNLSSPLRLGSGYKLSYLKNRYDFKIKDFLVWHTFFGILNLFPLMLIFFMYATYFDVVLIVNNLIIIVGLVALFITFLYLIENDVVKQRFNFNFNFTFFSKNNLLIQTNNVLFFFSNSLIVFIILESLTVKISFFSALAYSFLSSFVNLLNVTPGNIGVKEGLIILFNQVHKISYLSIIITSFIERLASLIVLFCFQLYFKNKSEIF
jgi:uncharacterized membrane protein YbhN (UPF0104 family)